MMGLFATRSRKLLLTAGSVLALIAGGIVYAIAGAPGTGGRQAEVAANGRQVMPFDLDRTSHTFISLPSGGRQTATADDPADGEQIRLIREHLLKEAAAFTRGDFSDPTTVHGPGMPGIAELSAAGRIAVGYQDLPGGAELTYTTTDPALIAAIHAWFAAQLSDHGSHAQPG